MHLIICRFYRYQRGTDHLPEHLVVYKRKIRSDHSQSGYLSDSEHQDNMISNDCVVLLPLSLIETNL